MSEEAAFLAALKANPADDVARLVYADWLDEHDEPKKAEYLRAVAELARTNAAPSEEFLMLACELPFDWRLDTAARFSLVLDSFEPGTKIEAIKLVREMTGMGLAEAKRFVEQAPSRFPCRSTAEGANGLVRYFFPGVMQIEPNIPSGGAAPVVATFSVTASLQPRDIWEAENLYPPEAQATFLAFVSAATGVSQDKAATMAGEYFIVTLGAELGYPRAQAEMDRCRKLLPPDDPEREWNIVLHIHPVLPRT